MNKLPAKNQHEVTLSTDKKYKTVKDSLQAAVEEKLNALPSEEAVMQSVYCRRYLAMGNDRSLAKVARKYSFSVSKVKKWSVAFNWQERVREYDGEEAARWAELMEKIGARLMILRGGRT